MPTQPGVPSVHPYIRQSIFLHSSEVWSWWQLAKQGVSDVLPSQDAFQHHLAFQASMRNVTTPAISESTLQTISLLNLPRKAAMEIYYLDTEPSHVALSELLPGI